MTLPRYAAYQESGHAWLGQVPSHWRVVRLKVGLSLRTEKAEQRTNPIALENIESWSGKFIATESEFEGDGVAFGRGDLLFGKLRPYLAKVFLPDVSGEAVGDFHVLRLVAGVHGRFVQHQMLNRAFIDVIDGSTFGSKMPRASWEDLGNMPLVVPPLAEQEAIATFLDRETAKIDALISEQEKLIALLAEKRQATISHVVTRGLNPNAPMKDSGVPWLGDVPAHWALVPAKRVASIFVPQRNKPELNDVGDGVRWATMEDMKQPRLRSTGLFVSKDAIAAAGSRVLGPGAVIASCVGNFGVATINEVDVVINQQLQAFVPGPSVLAEFLAVVVLASSTYFELVGTAATLVYVNQEGFENLPVPLPPLTEQKAILAKLYVDLFNIGELGAQSQRAIDLLKERRSALIAAAVTGQIDVRVLVPQDLAPA